MYYDGSTSRPGLAAALSVGTPRKEGLLTSLQSAFEYIEQFAECWIAQAEIPGLAIAVTDREELLRAGT